MRAALFAAVLAVVAGLTTGAQAHTSTTHMINGTGIAGSNTVTIVGADQLLDTGTVLIGSTTVVLTCVEVIQSGTGTHLAGMFGTGGGAVWTITLREPAPGTSFIIVNNSPFAPPTNANMCGIGNVGATGTGAFVIA